MRYANPFERLSGPMRRSFLQRRKLLSSDFYGPPEVRVLWSVHHLMRSAGTTIR